MLYVNSILLQEAEMILLLMLVLATQTRDLDPYKVTPLPGNPWVYYEAHGEARLIHSYWNILTTLDCRSFSQPMEWKETQMYSVWRSCIEAVGHECHNVIPLESLRKQLKSLVITRGSAPVFYTAIHGRAEFTTSSAFHHEKSSPIRIYWMDFQETFWNHGLRRPW